MRSRGRGGEEAYACGGYDGETHEGLHLAVGDDGGGVGAAVVHEVEGGELAHQVPSYFACGALYEDEAADGGLGLAHGVLLDLGVSYGAVYEDVEDAVFAHLLHCGKNFGIVYHQIAPAVWAVLYFRTGWCVLSVMGAALGKRGVRFGVMVVYCHLAGTYFPGNRKRIGTIQYHRLSAYVMFRLAAVVCGRNACKCLVFCIISVYVCEDT